MTKILIDEALVRRTLERVVHLKDYPTAMWDEEDDQVEADLHQTLEQSAHLEPAVNDRVMTVVYKNITADDALSFTSHPKAIWFGWCHAPYQRDEALRQALEQPAQERPQNCGTGYCSCIECLYEQTAPAQPWVGLTDEEIIKCWGQVSGTRCGYVAFARAVEAKLKKKNT